MPDSEWYASEEFWRWSFPFMFPARRFEQATEEVDQIVGLSEVEGGRVLDLACGPGRHAVELAKRGFDVTGVDRSPSLLDHARRNAVSAGVDIEWVEQDMRAFVRPTSFDLALSIFFRVWIYSGSELRHMLEEAGFESVALYGGLDGRAYDVDAQRLVAVATKPGA